MVAFLLLILVNAALFVRPSEIVPGLEYVPIYNILITSCLLLSFPAVLRELSPSSLARTPLNVCVVGLLLAGMLSHLSQRDLTSTQEFLVEFGKVVLYDLLLVGLLDSTSRMRTFLAGLVVMIGIVSVLSLLHYYGVITISSMKVLERVEENSRGEVVTVLQLYGTGIFADPNDLSLLMTLGIGLSLYRVDEPRSSGRWLWLAPLGLFVYTLALTNSRGGFLAMLACLLGAFVGRFGWRKSIPIAAVVLPVMFVLFGGRQTDLSTSSGTGQQRIQLWVESFQVFRARPLFGLGVNLLPDEIGHVAHNTYVHAFAEQGFLGGALFVGLYGLVFRELIVVGRHGAEVVDPRLRRLGPYLLGSAVGYAVGILTLSRNYVNPTYLIPALVAAYLRLVEDDTDGAIPLLRSDLKLVRRLVVWGVAAVILWYVYVRIFARFGD